MTDISVIYDQKWQKLLRRAWLFRFVPFAESVLVAGSMAIGNIHPDSDFDVIVLTKPGRLYTARFFCLALFTLIGWRRTINSPRDGFCFNYFAAAETFKLLNFNEYSEEMNCKLIPLLGRFNKNAYKNYQLRHKGQLPALSALFLEIILGGLAGNLFELAARRWQTRNIKKFIANFTLGPDSEIIFNEEKVQICLNLKKI